MQKAGLTLLADMDKTKKLIERNSEFYEQLEILTNEVSEMKERMTHEIEKIVDTYNNDKFTFKIREKFA